MSVFELTAGGNHNYQRSVKFKMRSCSFNDIEDLYVPSKVESHASMSDILGCEQQNSLRLYGHAFQIGRLR